MLGPKQAQLRRGDTVFLSGRVNVGANARIGLDGTKFQEVKPWKTPAVTMIGIERWDP